VLLRDRGASAWSIRGGCLVGIDAGPQQPSPERHNNNQNQQSKRRTTQRPTPCSDLRPMLEHRWRDFAGLADRPEVHLVNDEARSWLTRNDQRFDVLQMSLIDTWAATGAGAFTLSENGLYTLEAWRVFLGSLKPTGIFSVSRWYSPEKASETSRLLSLGTATLLDRGVAATLKRQRIAAPSLQHKQDLATVIHLCGAGAGEIYAHRGFRLTPGQRCGDHDVREYLGRVNGMKRLFARLARET
jgi:hypothetical protein